MRYFRKTNKLTRKFTYLLLGFAALVLSGAAEATMVVIANPALKVNQLSKQQLAAIYLKKPLSLKVNVDPYNQPEDSKPFKAFYQQILSWNADDLSSYWATQIFSGYSQEPPSVNNDQAAINIVENDSHAIAYVDSSSLSHVGNRVKVIYGHYKIPVAQTPKTTQATSVSQPEKLYSSSVNNGYMLALSSDPASDNSNDTHGPSSDPDVDLAQQLTAINNANPNQRGQNIWNLIASHMTLQNQDNNPAVRHWILWFQSHPNVLNTIIDNATPYLYYVYWQTQRHHIPAEFALLPMIESGYNPRAYSSAGAAGLWQLMPGTASSYGMAIDWWYDSRRDILTSTNAALNFLVSLHEETKSWPLAAAAYNEGPGALESAIHRNQAEGKSTDFWALRLPKETENYVPKLLALSAIVANPSKYDVKLPFVPDHPFFGSVTLTSQMDLKEISQFSGVSIPILKALNPGLQRWATAPTGKFTLLLPVMSVNTFEANLQHVIGQPHISWQYYRANTDDTLASIAADHGISVSKLKRVNHLHSVDVHAGEGILVPVQLHQVYTKLAGVAGAMNLKSTQEKILANALKRATVSQQKALPPEVTDEPIKSTDNLKSILGKLYGSD